MKKVSTEDKIQYAIKYKVTKLNKYNFLLFPLCLVKGHEEENGFKTDTELIGYAEEKEDFKNRYVVDMIYDLDELEYAYDYYSGEKEFLAKYFYEDYRNVIILVNTENDSITKLDIDFIKSADQSIDAAYCMDESYPSVVLNAKSVDELLNTKNKKELELLLLRYKGQMEDFKDLNRDRKVSRIYVSNGKVNYIETLKKVPTEEIDKKIETIMDEEIDKMEEAEIDKNGVSYNGLRQYIKERIYGHDEAIDTLAQKIYMNYTAEGNETVESILLVGPTGTGKTETVHAACEYLNIPSYEVNASNIVPQGIKGMSIEDVITGLYESAGRNVKKAEKGIIFLDEFDKLNDSDLDLKEPVKDILLTFTAGGNFPIENDRYKFDFNSSRTTKIYAGVFDRITEKVKSLGFNSTPEGNEKLGSAEEIRKKIIEKEYFTQEELTRISTILAYNELDRETKKQILISSKLSEFTKKKNRYKRQFKIDLIADDTYIEAILDTIDKDAQGMRNINNYVKETINTVERKILEGEVQKNKQLILTRDTVEDPNKFEVR